MAGWRADPLGGLRVALVEGLEEPPPPSPWPALEPGALGEAELRPWVLRGVYERLQSGQGRFMADLRPVTALFLAFDGIGYDEDDDAGILLDAYVRRVQAVVARYGGSLIQLTFGDKGSYLYAAFGAPVAHDDDAAKAVTVALQLLEPPPNLSFVHSVRAGVAEGQMYTGAYGSALRRTYGALGDKTNLAGLGQVVGRRQHVEGAPGDGVDALDAGVAQGEAAHRARRHRGPDRQGGRAALEGHRRHGGHRPLHRQRRRQGPRAGVVVEPGGEGVAAEAHHAAAVAVDLGDEDVVDGVEPVGELLSPPLGAQGLRQGLGQAGEAGDVHRQRGAPGPVRQAHPPGQRLPAVGREVGG
ncbi:hypothetical protein Mterra_02621 [Calidithermus terrae]|uniref:Guanylate cyclase domain-containing protein n=1 Tax=Calidithermus terrae TaxID=1408545 RepID=A0A399ED32_9DEIN|nr:hypothetical protein Mterra_02621 [Calidithermus terrae]